MGMARQLGNAGSRLQHQPVAQQLRQRLQPLHLCPQLAPCRACATAAALPALPSTVDLHVEAQALQVRHRRRQLLRRRAANHQLRVVRQGELPQAAASGNGGSAVAILGRSRING